MHLVGYPMVGSVFKEFFKSYDQANENWGEPALHQLPLRKPSQIKHLKTC